MKADLANSRDPANVAGDPAPKSPIPQPRVPSLEERYRLLLRISQAANAHLEFAAVLEALAEALRPLVPVDVAAVVTVEAEALRPHAIHVVGVKRKAGESFQSVAARMLRCSPTEVNARVPARFPLAGSAVEHVGRTGKALVSEDLERDVRFPEDERLLSCGLRSCVRCPLVVRDRLVGNIAFCNFRPRRFAPEEVQLLEDVSAVIATAVTNSLAYAEIQILKDQLHAENLLLKAEVDQRAMFEEIVGSSPAVRRVLAAIEKVAPTDSTVLITGETGTGKELVARAIHKGSRRCDRAMIKVNCAALPETLIASELFGHEKGAFTGAFERHIGRFELANGGTIFIDEVGELPADMQVAFLRVLQDGEFERVGGRQTLRTDARVIAATNRDLSAAVASGRFRSDLFYRLNVFPIEAPPLRQRREDIRLLVEYFVARFSTRTGKKIRGIDQGTMQLLVSYDWPGNVRELQNIIERAVILSDDGILRIEPSALGLLDPPMRPRRGKGNVLRDREKELIEAALAETRGRVSGPSGAATKLGIPASTLESKIKRLKIDKYRFHSHP